MDQINVPIIWVTMMIIIIMIKDHDPPEFPDPQIFEQIKNFGINASVILMMMMVIQNF